MSCSICRCAPLSPRAAANEHQVAALQSYVACFRDGTLASHVQGSRHWVQDKGPTVESYIGFIESYQLRRVYWSSLLLLATCGSSRGHWASFVMHPACSNEMVPSTTTGVESARVTCGPDLLLCMCRTLHCPQGPVRCAWGVGGLRGLRQRSADHQVFHPGGGGGEGATV